MRDYQNLKVTYCYRISPVENGPAIVKKIRIENNKFEEASKNNKSLVRLIKEELGVSPHPNFIRVERVSRV